jgi:hypothetical protein
MKLWHRLDMVPARAFERELRDELFLLWVGDCAFYSTKFARTVYEAQRLHLARCSQRSVCRAGEKE